MIDEDDLLGLGTDPKSEWPKLKGKYASATPQQLLTQSETHKRVLQYLLARVKMSEKEMDKLKPRWRVNEIKYQAYIQLNKHDKELSQLNDTGAAPLS